MKGRLGFLGDFLKHRDGMYISLTSARMSSAKLTCGTPVASQAGEL